MAYNKFDREILAKAILILKREKEFEVAERVRQTLWNKEHM